MALHLIPDDGAPHAPSTECGCDIRPILITTSDGITRAAFYHPPIRDLREVTGDVRTRRERPRTG